MKAQEYFPIFQRLQEVIEMASELQDLEVCSHILFSFWAKPMHAFSLSAELCFGWRGNANVCLG